ncbi:MAG: reverse transcriptase domain-containing protein [Euryarchaeota archaeon]|nr:reverse transcriptase domain-containing protein [Euryarchaeota archaeon]
MYDYGVQALHALLVATYCRNAHDPRSFGFRMHRSTQDARQYAYCCLGGKHSAKWVLEGDIKGCFDNINHDWLLENVPMDKSTLKQFLKAGFVYNRHLNPTTAGTPQGGIISPILANMTLDGMEKAISSVYHVGKNGEIDKTRYNPHKVNFVRYADDFFVTANSEETAMDLAELIKEFLMERGLELPEEKTHITHIDDGFDFLGWTNRQIHRKASDKAIQEIDWEYHP